MFDMFYEALQAFPNVYPSDEEVSHFWRENGYIDDEVQQALCFLTALKRITKVPCISAQAQGMRLYSRLEKATLGVTGLRYIQHLEQIGALSVDMREHLINCAELTGERSMPLDRLRLLLRLILWQCNQPISPLFREEIIGRDEDEMPMSFH